MHAAPGFEVGVLDAADGDDAGGIDQAIEASGLLLDGGDDAQPVGFGGDVKRVSNVPMSNNTAGKIAGDCNAALFFDALAIADPIAPAAPVTRTILSLSRVTGVCGLRRRDPDAGLLAGIGDVADSGALHVALPAQIVEVGAAVHGAAIVPDHQIVDAPAMGIDELALGGVRNELLDQRAAVRLPDMPKMRPAWDAR